MFSEAVLDHFKNPRNVGECANADAVVEATNPVCGDVLKLSARVEQRRIVEVRFLCRGCTTAIACASCITGQLAGQDLSETHKLTAEDLSEALGGLAPATFHAAELACEAANALIAKLASRRP
ncbi:MAG: Fe-S cluster assembly scaffold protein NifU [Candidatus Acidiferrum sp.]